MYRLEGFNQNVNMIFYPGSRNPAKIAAFTACIIILVELTIENLSAANQDQPRSTARTKLAKGRTLFVSPFIFGMFINGLMYPSTSPMPTGLPWPKPSSTRSPKPCPPAGSTTELPEKRTTTTRMARTTTTKPPKSTTLGPVTIRPGFDIFVNTCESTHNEIRKNYEDTKPLEVDMKVSSSYRSGSFGSLRFGDGH